MGFASATEAFAHEVAQRVHLRRNQPTNDVRPDIQAVIAEVCLEWGVEPQRSGVSRVVRQVLAEMRRYVGVKQYAIVHQDKFRLWVEMLEAPPAVAAVDPHVGTSNA